jgi:capsule polysaccharide export protein KpsE/RkpR
MTNQSHSAEEVVMEVMHHFGFRRNYQVAEYFEVTPQTLSGWIKTGEIPPKHLMKYTAEVLGNKNQDKVASLSPDLSSSNKETSIDVATTQKFSGIQTKKLLKNNLKILFGLPIIITLFMSVYVFWIANPVYTSVSKVLPISEDGSSSSGFSGVAAQLGISIPLSMGGTVPWDEVYPEIVKSSNLLRTVMAQNYNTEKYGIQSLENILIEEHGLSNYPQNESVNRAMDELKKMIAISKDRLSPVVTLEVAAFEPAFAAELSSQLIKKSSQIQRQLKTNRVRQKRLFIEERLSEVSIEMKKMEKELREFREYNRNLSSSPSLEMRAQEMGREINLQNSLYITLKTQHEKAKIEEVERDDMVQIIDGPHIPTKLTRPRRGLSIILSLFFGIFAALFTIYFRENYLEQNPYNSPL